MEEERDDLDNYMQGLVDLMGEDRQGVGSDNLWEIGTTVREIPEKHGDHQWRNR
jgi:hypothetical protein